MSWLLNKTNLGKVSPRISIFTAKRTAKTAITVSVGGYVSPKSWQILNIKTKLSLIFILLGFYCKIEKITLKRWDSALPTYWPNIINYRAQEKGCAIKEYMYAKVPASMDTYLIKNLNTPTFYQFLRTKIKIRVF